MIVPERWFVLTTAPPKTLRSQLHPEDGDETVIRFVLPPAC